MLGDAVNLRNALYGVSNGLSVAKTEQLKEAVGPRQDPDELLLLEHLRDDIAQGYVRADPEAVQELDKMIERGADRRVSDYIVSVPDWLKRHSFLDDSGTANRYSTPVRILEGVGSVLTVPLAFGTLLGMGPPAMISRFIEDSFMDPRD